MSRKKNHFWSWLCVPKKEWHVYHTDAIGIDRFICGGMERKWARHIAKVLNTIGGIYQ